MTAFPTYQLCPVVTLVRIQYNFIKPHMALDGQTPAETAGLGLKGKNKWINLLDLAMRNL